MPSEIDYDLSLDKTIRCRGCKESDTHHKEGEYFGNMIINGTTWAIILWDGEEDPDLFKAELLEIESKKWTKIT